MRNTAAPLGVLSAFLCTRDVLLPWNIRANPETVHRFGRGSALILARQIRNLASHYVSLQFFKRPTENTKRREVAAHESSRLAGPTGLEPATSGVTGLRVLLLTLGRRRQNMARRGSDIGAEIDALFQLSLAEFTGARNALAKRLKNEGWALDAERVKALAKPSSPAWAVNQLYWQDPKAIERLLTLGERIRRAQTGQLKNADLRALIEEKKQMTMALLAKASAILEQAGHAASLDSMRRVSATLESLAAWGSMEGVPRAGRLTAELDPPGFDTLAVLMGGKKLEAEKVLLFRAPKPVEDPAAMRARLHEAVQAAEKALREAHRDAERAESALAKATARVAAVEKQKQEIEARSAEAKEAARLASSEAKKAAQAVAAAERSLAKAKGT